jgi:hypothetical protein
MSWQEFEQLVDDAESDRELRWVLRHCRSAEDLILAARKLGYRVTRVDLQRAIEEGREEQRLRWLDAHCETINPADGRAWAVAEQVTEQKERL